MISQLVIMWYSLVDCLIVFVYVDQRRRVNLRTKVVMFSTQACMKSNICISCFIYIVIFPIQNQYKSYLIKNCMHFFVFLFLFKHKKKRTALRKSGLISNGCSGREIYLVYTIINNYANIFFVTMILGKRIITK